MRPPATRVRRTIAAATALTACMTLAAAGTLAAWSASDTTTGIHVTTGNIDLAAQVTSFTVYAGSCGTHGCPLPAADRPSYRAMPGDTIEIAAVVNAHFAGHDTLTGDLHLDPATIVTNPAVRNWTTVTASSGGANLLTTGRHLRFDAAHDWQQTVPATITITLAPDMPQDAAQAAQHAVTAHTLTFELRQVRHP